MTVTSLEVFVIILSTVICRLEGLEITQHPTSQNVSEGDNVTFTCGFNSSQEEYDVYRRVWYRKLEGEAFLTALTDGLYVNPSLPGRFAISQDELSIAPVLFNDTGTYYCRFEHHIMGLIIPSYKAQLDVYTLPADQLCYIQRVINNKQYVCTSNIKGDNIYWRYEKKLILQKVIKFVENDTRTLQCYVNNSFGVPSRTCTINNHCVVQHEFDGLIVIGDDAAFTCNCRFQQLWSVTSWIYNGSKISSSKERFSVSDSSLIMKKVQEKDNGLLIRCNANYKMKEVSSGWLKIQALLKTSTIKTTTATVTPTNDSMSFLKYIAFALIVLLCVITVGGMRYCCIRSQKKKASDKQLSPTNGTDSTQLPMIATPIHFAQYKQESDSNTYENSDIKINVSNDNKGLPVYASTIEVTDVVYDNLTTDTGEISFEDDEYLHLDKNYINCQFTR